MQRITRVRGAWRTGARAASGGAGGAESPLRRLVREAGAFGEAAPAEGELRWATQPYAAHAGSAAAAAAPPRPEETTVLLFPGEDAHFVGMGRRLQELPAARDLYELASSIVGWDVARVCREGPAAELRARAGPCVLATALAALELAREARPAALQRVRAAAGYALAGELAALVYAAALPLHAALRLLLLHDAAVQAADAERPGGALEVRLAPDARLGELLARAGERAAERGAAGASCRVAAYLAPARKLLAGDEEALRFVEAEGRAWGVAAVARALAPSAAHPAGAARVEAALRAALRALPVSAPRVRVVSCVDARAHGASAGAVRARVARLAAAPLRWEQALHALYARPRAAPQPLTLALGPAAALRRSLRRVNARAWDACVHIDV